jgi:hypothetical protein
MEYFILLLSTHIFQRIRSKSVVRPYIGPLVKILGNAGKKVGKWSIAHRFSHSGLNPDHFYPSPRYSSSANRTYVLRPRLNKCTPPLQELNCLYMQNFAIRSSELRFFIPDCLNLSPAKVFITHGFKVSGRPLRPLAFGDTADYAFLAAAGRRRPAAAHPTWF